MWRAKITQTALAPELGIGQTALSHKLRGKRGWSADDLVTVSRHFGVSIDYLFGFTDDMGPSSAPNLPPSDYIAVGSAEVIDLATRRAVA